MEDHRGSDKLSTSHSDSCNESVLNIYQLKIAYELLPLVHKVTTTEIPWHNYNLFLG